MAEGQITAVETILNNPIGSIFLNMHRTFPPLETDLEDILEGIRENNSLDVGKVIDNLIENKLYEDFMNQFYKVLEFENRFEDCDDIMVKKTFWDGDDIYKNSGIKSNLSKKLKNIYMQDSNDYNNQISQYMFGMKYIFKNFREHINYDYEKNKILSDRKQITNIREYLPIKEQLITLKTNQDKQLITKIKEILNDFSLLD